jgi:hypothetical protein
MCIIIYTHNIVVSYYDLEKSLKEVYVVYVSIVNNLRKFGRHNCATRRKMGIWLSTCLRKYTKRRFRRQLDGTADSWGPGSRQFT